MTQTNTMPKSEALTVQVGGDHYSKLPIQPMEFATANRYDPCAFSILKYVTRWRDKGGLKDLQKSLHIAQMRQTKEISQHFPDRKGELPAMLSYDYTTKNRLGAQETHIIMWLQDWVYSRHGDTHAPQHVVRLLQQLISENGG